MVDEETEAMMADRRERTRARLAQQVAVFKSECSLCGGARMPLERVSACWRVCPDCDVATGPRPHDSLGG